MKATGVENEFGMDPEDCVNLECTCYGPRALGKLAHRLQYAEWCSIELKRADQSLAKADKLKWQPAWYQKPEIIIGGTVVSFAFGAGLVAYLLLK